jgi:uncharacterized membrane protein SpoIIM required for sporulation/uncharacterized RDD family membrane protein YckC
MTPPLRATHRQHLTIETPEHVALDYELAGLGSRMLAFVADAAVIAGLFAGTATLVRVLGAMADPWSVVFLSVVGFGLYWGYFVIFEGFFEGRTPGKRWVGIRVVRDSGHAATVGDAAVRNLLRVADALPPPFLLGLGLIAFHPRAKRLGDIVAGTVVVRDRPIETAEQLDRPAPSETAVLAAPALSDAEYRVLSDFLDRAAALDPAVRARFVDRLLTRFGDKLEPADDGLVALRALQIEEQTRRAGRLAGRAGGRAGPAAGAMGDRLASAKAERWAEFDQIARTVSLDGLDRLSAGELIDFAARYREVAADLARARTYRAMPSIVHRLERLVAAGHNVLYRRERGSLDRTRRFLFEECPAALIEARRAILLAFLAFAAPAAAGYLLLRERPALAAEVIPDVMLERAAAGAERQRAGKGYYDAEPGARPLMATSIIANNVTVAFYCFAGGIFLGVGSLAMLGFNGLQIGSATGHFANLGLFAYLWTFIAGHGLLELFAIWVAGAAGLLLGGAIVAPGRATRRDALVAAGRVAVRLIASVVIFLLLAGLVEGFVSSSRLPLTARLAVSGASAAFLVLYLLNGVRHRRLERLSPASWW